MYDRCMRILFVTSECVPFFKKGGLGDVSHALPAALSRLGVSVTITLPYYETIKIKQRESVCIGPIVVDYAGKRELVFVFRTRLPSTRVDVLLFRHPRLFQYKEQAFPFYCLSVANWYRHMAACGNPYTIVHCNDWHTALIPLLLGEEDKIGKRKVKTLQSVDAKTILTVHNLLYHGIVSSSIIHDVGLPIGIFHKVSSHNGGMVNLLREGLEHTDIISTVSASYAKEMVSPFYGPHIYEVLKRRHHEIIGILNGIDAFVWDPRTDDSLPVNFSIKTVFEGKKENKMKLQKAVGLPVSDDMLFGFIGRIDPNQKGVDLIMEAVRRMSGKKFQVVLLGTGDKKQVSALEKMDGKEKNVAYVSTFDERLARRIYAGSDVILVPSKFEPCGLTQMIAMRYGTIPLVRKTGGLADSVVDGETGFVFDQYRAEDLCRAMWRAIVLREDIPNIWNSMVKRVMREDFSWEASAKEYRKVYKKLASKGEAFRS